MHRAFTLIEVLVAMSIFIALMLIGSMAFSNFQRVADESLRQVRLTAKTDALNGFLDQHLGQALSHAALQLQIDSDGRQRIVYMEPFPRDLTERFTQLRSQTYKDLYQADRIQNEGTDQVWALFEWHDGSLYYNHSRLPLYRRDRVDSQNTEWRTVVGSYLRPTMQRNIAHLIGRDDVDVEPGQPYRRGPLYSHWQVSEHSESYRRLGKYGDHDGDGETADEYGDWLGMNLELGWFGDENPLDGTFAVANENGRSYNRDWMALMGCPEQPDYFPVLRLLVFEGIEFMTIEALDRQGDILTGEDDGLGDGTTSRDWLGLPINGHPTANAMLARPAAFRCSYLIHTLDETVIDIDDVDGDGDTDETLAQAMQTSVANDAALTSDEQRRHAMRDRLATMGYSAIACTHIVRLPL